MVLIIPLWANEKINTTLKEYAWEKRQLIVFSPSVNDDQYKLFLKVQSEFMDEFKDRRLHVWHVISGQKVKLDQEIRADLNDSDFQGAFDVRNTEFKVILVGYDLQEKLRQDKVQIDYLFSKIDQMPMRIQEMQESVR
jgi:hypothetical protein